MGAQQRVFKQKIRSTQSLRKIFKAMELIAASRIQKAIARSQAASPYANALTRAVSAVASESNVDHVLTSEPESVTRAAVLVVGPDRGFAGAYSANLLREAEELIRLLREEGKDVQLFTVGGKAKNYYTFRDRAIERAWTGISENPTAENAREIGEALLDSFDPESAEHGVDEIYIVFTKFVSSVNHDPEYRRLLPLEVVDADEASSGNRTETAANATALPLYEFEPSAEAVLDALLPRYIDSRILSALLSASASEQASRQAAMKTATDNADDLIKTYTRLANTARQAEITQELTEIVGGADALAASAAGD
ncbi:MULTISPECIES: F0F1 ATP synthase subunit gamma [unclassified Brevibacterium]|uniref:F0F1 ATP synthase subunit gamma n=1 Tax=unclassified Brevibacterium TaxID=2614124 RepID=UPI001E3384AD|nr:MULTISPECIES: F0F1 ATP synthase subunit gamma [unclassified Brevibacterium]MCD1284658.1 F0F1 ATP synthase subunit gamma [Brevibacterium sp. CCUG 69071]MDK8435724.1 F0F1 ATP synthase subunit gamma [Brevibacterium sp. H-BE7]